MDPVGAAVAIVLAASALYRTLAGRREALTAGLWTAAVGMAVSALVVPLDAALKSLTGLDSLSQLLCYSAMVISSYLIARMTYHVADIDSRWPLVFTVTSITGMIALYSATDLRHIQTLAIETVPGAASAWFAIFYAIGLLPTHISAIIGVLKMTHKDNVMVWLLATYGAVGALNPILIVADHIGTYTLRWPLSVTYPLVWIILFISFGALAVAGVIGAHRSKQEHTELASGTT
ncbi:hypothetical protein BKG82_27235 [Mycobacteroides chelonae]|uniref:Uncharacterized protein n=1 Tax=Mycobacteroides chelonae TaxID=1774 RepID=A0A1S1LI18_MYCCH|nr:hypothetical protein [Mycobacteroides chelonae]OHU47347.1 hypothetical protein BKG82_27235 [Mycobacteroides chelonae]